MFMGAGYIDQVLRTQQPDVAFKNYPPANYFCLVLKIQSLETGWHL